MELEGFEHLKTACDTKPLINLPDPTCSHGAPWNSMYTQHIMGGKLPGSGSKIVNDDNFHPVY
jgi:hypothetical protein